MKLSITTLDAAIDKFTSLKLCTVGTEGDRHERPNKALVLLVALDLLDEGKATPLHVPWNAEFRERFSHYFSQVKRSEDIDSAETQFWNLRNDGIWQTYRIVGGEMEPCDIQPSPADDGEVFAAFTYGIEDILEDPAARQQLRKSLLARYFPALAEA